MKYFEYTHKFHEGLFPGRFFNPIEPEAAEKPSSWLNQILGMYFSFYFMMTGLHGSHVIAGMGLITWLHYSRPSGRV